MTTFFGLLAFSVKETIEGAYLIRKKTCLTFLFVRQAFFHYCTLYPVTTIFGVVPRVSSSLNRNETLFCSPGSSEK